MLPDRVSNPGPLTYESDALPIALRGPAPQKVYFILLKGHSWSALIAKPLHRCLCCLQV